MVEPLYERNDLLIMLPEQEQGIFAFVLKEMAIIGSVHLAWLDHMMFIASTQQQG